MKTVFVIYRKDTDKPDIEAHLPNEFIPKWSVSIFNEREEAEKYLKIGGGEYGYVEEVRVF